MKKYFYSLGLMSGTSGDGVDASIIQSDGDNEYNTIIDRYYKYDSHIYQEIHNLKSKINSTKDLKIFKKELKILEKKITLFHAIAANKIIQISKYNIDLIGFHGQTILHNAKKKISIQLGNPQLLSKITKKNIVYNFRKNDLKNGGQGAPLASIFHKLLIARLKIKLPACVLNLGGIANATIIKSNKPNNFYSFDIGPGNCLIDKWIRLHSRKKFDLNGLISKSGKANKILLTNEIKKFYKYKSKINLSLDTKDFDLSFVKKLSFKDGAATLTEFSGNIISETLSNFLVKKYNKSWKILVCGGGRKNKTLIDFIKKKINKNLTLYNIDKFNINGDFIESQAFAYLAIRSYLNLPISFPETTGVKKPCSGGLIFKFKL